MSSLMSVHQRGLTTWSRPTGADQYTPLFRGGRGGGIQMIYRQKMCFVFQNKMLLKKTQKTIFFRVTEFAEINDKCVALVINIHDHGNISLLRHHLEIGCFYKVSRFQVYF